MTAAVSTTPPARMPTFKKSYTKVLGSSQTALSWLCAAVSLIIVIPAAGLIQIQVFLQQQAPWMPAGARPLLQGTQYWNDVSFWYSHRQPPQQPDDSLVDSILVRSYTTLVMLYLLAQVARRRVEALLKNKTVSRSWLDRLAFVLVRRLHRSGFRVPVLDEAPPVTRLPDARTAEPVLVPEGIEAEEQPFDVTGSFKLISNEGFEAFLAVQGVPWALRRAANHGRSSTGFRTIALISIKKIGRAHV